MFRTVVWCCCRCFPVVDILIGKWLTCCFRCFGVVDVRLPPHPTPPHPGTIEQGDLNLPGTPGVPSPRMLSPGSFYSGGSSPSPTRSPPKSPTTREESSDEEGKENQGPSTPSSFVDKQSIPQETGTSKHFSASNGGGGGSGSGSSRGARLLTRGNKPVSSAAGLRRSFRSPLIATSTSSSGPTNCQGTSTETANAPRDFQARGSRGGDNGDDGGGGDGKSGLAHANPWEAAFACPTQTGRYPSKSTTGAANSIKAGFSDVGGGRSAGACGFGGKDLKRRRTLGVGTLAPRGLLRGLNGVSIPGRGSTRGIEARRSKNLRGKTWRMLFADKGRFVLVLCCAALCCCCYLEHSSY